MNLSKLKPLRNDIVFEVIEAEKHGQIETNVKSKYDISDGLTLCKALAVGPDCVDVSVGDKFWLPLGDRTTPYYLRDDNGHLVRVQITDESKALVVI